jgi:hypothetical protein
VVVFYRAPDLENGTDVPFLDPVLLYQSLYLFEIEYGNGINNVGLRQDRADTTLNAYIFWQMVSQNRI